jgi:hypothetical protein
VSVIEQRFDFVGAVKQAVLSMDVKMGETHRETKPPRRNNNVFGEKAAAQAAVFSPPLDLTGVSAPRALQGARPDQPFF